MEHFPNKDCLKYPRKQRESESWQRSSKIWSQKCQYWRKTIIWGYVEERGL